MRLWDLVEHDGQVWVVYRFIDTKVGFLQNPFGQKIEVPFDADQQGLVKVVANPPAEWPFLMVRDNPKGSAIIRVTRFSGTVGKELRPYYDWSLSDPSRAGGALFLSPNLRIKPAETLLVGWKVGPDTLVKVPLNFNTVANRVARQVGRETEPTTVYDRLLMDHFGEDDE